MNSRPQNNNRSSGKHPFLVGLIYCALVFPSVRQTAAEEVDGFTEPYRTVNVASVELGIIKELKVREGQPVTSGMPLVRLDHDLQDALLAIAEKNKNARGQLNSALAELKLRRQRRQNLEKLAAQNHARPEEVERARADEAIAEAHLLSAQEDQLVRELEYNKIKVQLARRTIKAPIDGVVVQIHKRVGELVAPNDAYVLKVVELKKLLANFSVPAPSALHLHVGQKVVVRLAGVTTPATGEIEYVAPVTDAESGTVRVKVRIDNNKNTYRSGEQCSLQIPAPSRQAAR